jgi:uncharacterized protein YeaO (DUF488 family)
MGVITGAHTGTENMKRDVCTGANMIRVKRVYETPEEDDGQRILIERLWPRGIRTENAHIDLWMKEIAPSTGLRK